MTYLNDDFVFSKILADAGLLDPLYKKAQDTAAKTREITLNLAKNLLATNTINDLKNKTSEIYAKDLVDLTTFLNYLLSNGKKAEDGNSIVIQSKGINGAQIQEALKPLYAFYDDFWVHKNGILQYLSTLNEEGKKTGNEVLKLMVPHLISEVESKLKLSFKDMSEDPILNKRKSDGEENGSGSSNKGNGRGPSVPFAIDESAIKNVSDKQNGNNSSSKQNTNLGNDLKGIKPPFPDSNSINPYDMQLFVSMMDTVLKNNASLQGINFGVFEQLNANMQSSFRNWGAYIASISAKYSNARSWSDFVPLSGTPSTDLKTYYGSTYNARLAAQYLVQMAQITYQALNTMKRSPSLVAVFGDAYFIDQQSKAQSFVNKLTPIAMNVLPGE